MRRIRTALFFGFGLCAAAGCELGRDVVAVPMRSTTPQGGGGASSGAPTTYPSYAAQFGTGYGGATSTSTNNGSGQGGLLEGSGGYPYEPYAGAPSAGDGNAGSAGATGMPECSPAHPEVQVMSGSRMRTICTGTLARDRMSHAVCTCGDLAVQGLLATSAYDSLEASSLNTTGAAVGVNGTYTSGDYARVQGSFTIAGTSLLTLVGLDVAGDLKLAATGVSLGPIQVGRDAWFARSVSVLDETRIARDLHLARNATVTGLRDERVGGRTVRDVTEIAPPCRCGSEATFDLAANIETAREQNDNDRIGLSVQKLNQAASVAGAAGEGGSANTFELPCGTYFLSDMPISQPLQLRVTGRVALFVAGDVALRNDFTLDLGAEAELDWFIAGRLDLRGATRVGDPERAARLRIYVGSSSEITFPSAHVAGNLYAPRADVTVTGVGDVYGSIFARNLTSADALTVHYDRAILNLGDQCPAPANTACAGCGECGAGL
ncbi:MAG TPA: hypothetical protein VFQ61_15050, partial [Polyangiaceae bacterium]|nr:hypothetical protein [Polyangiaceae bacterium]